MTNKAYIALGSNMGDAAENLNDALKALDLVPGVTVTKVSKYYITEPWGYADQPDFTNACCEVETALSPEALLGVCLGIEAGMGRVRQIKNGPRVIDLDLLLYGNEKRDTEELILPNPRMRETRPTAPPAARPFPASVRKCFDGYLSFFAQSY